MDPVLPSARTSAAPRQLAAWLLLLGLALLPATLRAGWALDDRELLFGNPVVEGGLPWYAAFGRDYFHHLSDSGQWRPLATLSLRLDRALFDEWVTGYHLSNLALHLAVVATAAALLLRLGLSRVQVLFGATVFALHPALCDSVIWISGRTSMLSALFPLLGALAAEASRQRSKLARALPAALGLLAGMLAKEDALAFLPLLLYLAARRSKSDLRITGSACLLALALWFLGRGLALGDFLPSASSPAMGSAPLGERWIVGGNAVIEGLRLFVFPVDYPPQYRADLLLQVGRPLHSSLAALVGWLLLVAPAAWLWLRPGKSAFALALAALSFLPFTQLIPLGEIFAPRFLYLPMLFAIPVVGVLVDRWLSRPLLLALLAVLGLGSSLATWQRAQVYSSPMNWRAAVMRHHEPNAPSLNHWGLLLEEEGQIDGAIMAWRDATVVDPQYSKSWSNLGRVLMEHERFEEAESTLRHAVRFGPKNPIPRVNLASLLSKGGQHEEARELYQQATRLSPGLAPAWRGLAQSHLALGELDEAGKALNRARSLDPGAPTLQALEKRLESARRARSHGD